MIIIREHGIKRAENLYKVINMIFRKQPPQYTIEETSWTYSR